MKSCRQLVGHARPEIKMNLNDAEKLAKKLLDKYELYNWHFGFDNSKRRFGCCHGGTKWITLSRHLVKLNSESEVKNTILHEIAHALTHLRYGYYVKSHGKEWRKVALEIGCDGSRCHNAAMVKPKYIAYCERCNWKTKYHRQRDVACPDCCRRFNNGRYSRNYKLKWKKNIEE